jgi:hypothetical protein
MIEGDFMGFADEAEDTNYMTALVYADSKTSERRAMGRAIAELYLASHDVSPDLFKQVCEIKESFKYDIFVNYGFNERIKHTELNPRNT